MFFVLVVVLRSPEENGILLDANFNFLLFAVLAVLSSSSKAKSAELRSCIPAHSTMIYDIVIFIVIIFLTTTITYIIWLVWNYSVVAPPLQPEHNAGTEINNATLSTWPKLTYAEAKSRDPRAVNAICCFICLVDYEEEEGEDKSLRLLPECGHLFHATCVDPWLWRWQTYPTCRSLVVNSDMQMSLSEECKARIQELEGENERL